MLADVTVSADVTTDPKTSASYYVARIALNADAIKTLKDLRLVPGMPVEAFIEAGERTALSYLIKPFADQFARALKER